MMIDGEGEEDRQPESFEDFEARVNSGDEGEDETLELTEDDEEVDEKGDPVKDEGDEDDTEPKKGGMSAKDRIQQLNARNRENERRWDSERRGFEARLAALENNRLTEREGDGSEEVEDSPPDPKDEKKYPLGTLDDRYIEDSINYRVEQALKADRESSLQRQEQSEAEAEAERIVSELRSKADSVAEKGSTLHDDYDEVVVRAGLAGDYDLTQVTFEAAAEAEHGAQILYDLASDKAEATRVAKLSPLGQLQYVMEKNAGYAKGSQPNKIPGAGAPPSNPSRGGRSRKTISPATTDFAEFEKLANSESK